MARQLFATAPSRVIAKISAQIAVSLVFLVLGIVNHQPVLVGLGVLFLVLDGLLIAYGVVRTRRYMRQR